MKIVALMDLLSPFHPENESDGGFRSFFVAGRNEFDSCSVQVQHSED